VEGSWRFVQRLWRIIGDAVRKGASLNAPEPRNCSEAALALRRAAHRALAAVTDDLMGLRFNRAIARIYELANALSTALQNEKVDAGLAFALREASEIIVLMLAPMMPHLAEECWELLGHEGGPIALAPWPKPRDEFVRTDEVTIAVQVDGKRRDEIRLPKGLPKEEVEHAVLKLDNVRRALDGRSVQRIVVVPDRIVNIVSGFLGA
jgi:leucyl-tRNA synthetase